jgi:hypothetical protein
MLNSCKICKTHGAVIRQDMLYHAIKIWVQSCAIWFHAKNVYLWVSEKNIACYPTDASWSSNIFYSKAYCTVTVSTCKYKVMPTGSLFIGIQRPWDPWELPGATHTMPCHLWRWSATGWGQTQCWWQLEVKPKEYGNELQFRLARIVLDSQYR